MPTRVKICGITRPQDAALAAELGADALGLNFVGGPRKLTLPQASDILKVIPPLVEPVGLFSVGALAAVSGNDELAEIEWSVETKQWYGDVGNMEPWRWGPAGAPWWVVVHIAERASISAIPAQLARAKFRPQALLLDVASSSGQLGGTGQSFNWNWIADARSAGELEALPPLILAGGLTPDNVVEAIRIVRPYAVDVASGVEVSGKAGVKDPIKLRDFIQAAKSAP
jgi:phosphoribosylanthranilate isomerase